MHKRSAHSAFATCLEQWSGIPPSQLPRQPGATLGAPLSNRIICHPDHPHEAEVPSDEAFCMVPIRHEITNGSDEPLFLVLFMRAPETPYFPLAAALLLVSLALTMHWVSRYISVERDKWDVAILHNLQVGVVAFHQKIRTYSPVPDQREEEHRSEIEPINGRAEEILGSSSARSSTEFLDWNEVYVLDLATEHDDETHNAVERWRRVSRSERIHPFFVIGDMRVNHLASCYMIRKSRTEGPEDKYSGWLEISGSPFFYLPSSVRWTNSHSTFGTILRVPPGLARARLTSALGDD